MKCEVCRDLLPLYIDGLTSEVTNEEIELHMDQCDACREVYDDMSSAVEEELKKELQVPKKEEIDYLKKFQRKMKQFVSAGGLLLVLLLLVIVVFARRTASSKDIALNRCTYNGKYFLEGSWVGSPLSGSAGFNEATFEIFDEKGDVIGMEYVYTMKKQLLREDFLKVLFEGDDKRIFSTHGEPLESDRIRRDTFIFSDKTVTYENGKLIEDE